MTTKPASKTATRKAREPRTSGKPVASAGATRSKPSRGWYRISMTGPQGEVLVALAPLVTDSPTGSRFDPDAPKPALVWLKYGEGIYCGELDVDVDEEPARARVVWHNAYPDSAIDLFSAPLRVGSAVTATAIRSQDDTVEFALREISRLG